MEKLGLLAFQAFAYPLTWGMLYRQHEGLATVSPWIFPALAGLALLLLAGGVPAALPDLSRQWRWTWGLALAGGIGLLAGEMFVAPHWAVGYGRQNDPYHWVCTVGLFVFCLLQIQVGVQRRSESMVNLGVSFIGLLIIATYVNLVGSMARTGLMLFGIYLEKKRRSLMQQIKATAD
jgi:hypothetical protein